MFVSILTAALTASSPLPLPLPAPMFAEITRDPITDHVRAFAIQQDGLDRISVGCDPTRYRGIRVILTSARWLARGEIFVGSRGLTYRFDDLPPRRMLWQIKDRTARIQDRRNVRVFLGGLRDASQVVIRGRNIEEQRIDIVMRLVGVHAPLKQVLEACGAYEISEELFPTV